MRLRLETCARIAEIAGAIAVVVSVIYLAVQINDNTRLLRSQAHFNAINLGQRPLELMVQIQDLADIVVRCDSEPDAISPANWLRCGNYYFMQFNAWEYFYYQHADQAIPDELWVGADAYYKLLVSTNAGFARSWKELAATFDEPFRSYVNAEFAKVAVSADMQEFAEHHAVAWSSQDPARVAAAFAENGALIINGGTPSVGRAAVAEAARSFMTAYPDMVVTLDRLERIGDRYRFHWKFVGTNSGPGGTGREVRIGGYEEWTMGADGRIVQSLGNYDAADWDRQVGKPGLPES
jgi:hypothetical protein